MNALKKSMIAAVLAVVVAPSVANATAFGSLSNVSCDVVILRAGEYLKAVEGSAIQQGDVLITYGGSSANINFTEEVGQYCSGSIGELSLMPVSGTCSGLNNIQPISPVQEALGSSSCGAAYIPSSSGGEANLLALLGGAAALGLVVAAVDGNDDAPTSP